MPPGHLVKVGPGAWGPEATSRESARGTASLSHHARRDHTGGGVPPRADRSGLLLSGLLLARHRALRALARARVGAGALTVHRQAATVPQPLVAADLDLAPDVGGDLAAEVTLDLEVALDVVAELDEVVVAQVAHAAVGADARSRERLVRAGAPDAVDVGERHLEPLLAGEVDADEACHGMPFGRGGCLRHRPREPLRGSRVPGLRSGGGVPRCRRAPAVSRGSGAAEGSVR